MTSPAEAFVRALQDDPEDDTTALVFADWLDERGDPRGEFLRVQQELADWVPDLRRRTQLRQREQELLARHGMSWLGPLRDHCIDWHFERGLAYLTMPARRFVSRRFAARALNWFAQAWVAGVRLTRARGRVSVLAASPHLASVAELDLSGNELTNSDVYALVGSPHLARLRRLDLSNNHLTGDAFRVLPPAARRIATPASALTGLRWLNLRNNHASSSGIRALLRSWEFGELRWLGLQGNDMNPATLQAVADWHARRGRPAPPRLWNSLGMEFVRIPAGTFLMGSPTAEIGRYEDEGPRHEVTLTQPFYLGVYPVTQAQYAVAGANPSHFDRRNRGGPHHPVETVSWFDAAAFCRLLGELPGELKRGNTYRLPTEAEWEHACRAGSTTAFWCGAGLSSHQANFDGNHPYGGAEQGPYPARTSPVGSYPANAFGLYDMHGNVWEWCQDWYEEFHYPESSRADPSGPQSSDRRVLRGGSWFNNAGSCRSAYRYRDVPSGRSSHVGFRVVLVPGEDG
jgi:uncharacterized protein (TIGR02996 family)